jgi:DNA helicase-2/ATP-dependent DNA helicase PcrA
MHPSLRQKQTDDGGFRLGQRVKHSTFGEGIILNVEGNGAKTRVQVNFDYAGLKWLILSQANLMPA